MLLSLFKASGHSMEPEIKNGSFFIASSIPFLIQNPKIGDSVVFKNHDKIVVKEISKMENDKFVVKGKNLLDSKEFSPIKRDEILGKLIWTF